MRTVFDLGQLVLAVYLVSILFVIGVLGSVLKQGCATLST
jgi:Na+/H+-dicarboxylate symporter